MSCVTALPRGRSVGAADMSVRTGTATVCRRRETRVEAGCNLPGAPAPKAKPAVERPRHPRASSTPGRPRAMTGVRSGYDDEVGNETSVEALVTPQWWDGWERVQWAENGHVDGPVEGFITFVMAASQLKQLSGVYRRRPKKDETRSADDNVQRPHEENRSREIRRFVEQGYPRSSMTPAQRARSSDSDRRPGWLPTAVVINILEPGESRDGLAPLRQENAVTVDEHSWQGGQLTNIRLPAGSPECEGDDEQPSEETFPFEVIDGQHRLWAFEDTAETPDYYLPVIAFRRLSKEFQAYLFWTINIKPRKINTSLAFDLYPLLRSQEWLVKGEGLKVYRETRAQELTEALWATPLSPWYEKINMIGATGVGDSMPVTQASFVRAFTASFIRAWERVGNRSISGGLFSSDESGGLDWNRAQQAAFVIAGWRELVAAIERDAPEWWSKTQYEHPDAEVLSRFTVLGTDQGVRAVSLVLNDLAYALVDAFDLRSWRMEPTADVVSASEVTAAFEELQGTTIAELLQLVAAKIAMFDWRSSRFVTNPDEVRELETFRGSGGYVKLRRHLFELIQQSENRAVRDAAAELIVRADSQKRGR